MKTYIFGHRNPDTDSICSSIAYSYLKNQLEGNHEARSLGSLQKETEFVLDYFGIPAPPILSDVKVQVRDLQYTRVKPILSCNSILHAYREMERQQLKTMAIVDSQNFLLGLVTMKDIAKDMIHGDFYQIDTTVENILDGLKGRVITAPNPSIRIYGRVMVVAYCLTSFEESLSSNQIVIVGDRYDIIESAILNHVQLIVVTGGFEIPPDLIELAAKYGVPMIGASQDSYIVSKLIQQCNFISTVMENETLVKFEETDYLDEVKDDIIRSNYRNFPVIAENGKFMGFIGRKHLLNPGRKKVILVDHNEFAQSAKGIEEAEILEILDHHKIGGLNTKMPIRFLNIPVGSSCTIIYDQYKSQGIVPPREMAGAMLSGILSDTLLFKSPTCTRRDQEAAMELNEQLQLNMEEYFMQMFKAGTSIEGYSEEDILHRDFKEFKIKDYKIAIAQIFTLNIDEVIARKEKLLEYMTKEKESKEYGALLLAVTDIVKEGSYFLYKSDLEGILSGSFEVEEEQGVFVPLIVSRKKQIVPMIMSYVENNF